LDGNTGAFSFQLSAFSFQLLAFSFQLSALGSRFNNTRALPLIFAKAAG
jgi:hypothetical protein